jgi:hypothetical protein
VAVYRIKFEVQARTHHTPHLLTAAQRVGSTSTPTTTPSPAASSKLAVSGRRSVFRPRSTFVGYTFLPSPFQEQTSKGLVQVSTRQQCWFTIDLRRLDPVCILHTSRTLHLVCSDNLCLASRQVAPRPGPPPIPPLPSLPKSVNPASSSLIDAPRPCILISERDRLTLLSPPVALGAGPSS